jgi:hypothetical protein
MPCDWVQCIVDAAIAANPRMADQIINAVIAAAPMLRDCIGEPCFPANEFLPPHIIAPINPQNFRPVSPEQPPN